jgi:iron complex outermembrane receptor protein
LEDKGEYFMKSTLNLSLFKICTALTTFAGISTIQAAPVLEEIIVQAQKRAQNLQEVPTAISAFSAQDIEEAGFRNVDDLQTAVPSLVIGGDGSTRPFIYIRGVGSRKFDIGADGSVGVFIDEVYTARYNSIMSGIVDLERIEVLKGPQGTLYGRNTIGGAISMFTPKPTDEFSARIKAGVGNEGYYQIGGNVSGPLGEKLTGRLTFNTTDDDGVMSDTISGRDDGREMNTIRLDLSASPTDRLDVRFSAQYNDMSQDASLSRPVANQFPASSPFAGLTFGINPVPGVVEAAREELATSGDNPFSNAANTPGGVDNDNSQISLRIKYSAESFDITSITSRTDDDLVLREDFDATSFAALDTFYFVNSEQYSQEFRFTSTGEGRLSWVAGVYYFHDDGDLLQEFVFPSGGESILGPDGFLAVRIFGPAGLPVDSNDSSSGISLETDAFGVYGHAMYAVTDKLNLTAGLRYSDDEKSYSYSLTTNTPGFPIVPVAGGFDETLTFDSLDPVVTLDYEFSENIMGYITYSTGYKSGGPQFATFSLELARGGFDQEELETIEAGLKSRFMNERIQLNAALYRYDYTDQQVQSIIILNGGAQGFTSNAGESQMTGFEVDVVALLTDNLALDFSYNYLDAVFDRFDHPEGDRSGNRMEFAPKNALTFGLSYLMNIGEQGALNLRANYSWKNDYFIDSSNNPLTLQDAYGVVNLAAIWEINEDLRLRAFCDNCNDEEYFTQTTLFPGANGGRYKYATPRRYGLEVVYNF